MSAFLDAAERVLKARNEPMSPTELVDYAIKRAWLQTTGQTPSQTMKSKLSTDIRRRGGRSRFIRTEAGKFGLRVWKGRVEEYHAKRFAASLLDEDVLVFDATVLPQFVPKPGQLVPWLSSQTLLANCYSVRRRAAEQRYDIIQLISVFVLHHAGRYLTYKRSRRLPEARLHATYSLAFGGHLNPEDAPPLLDITVPDIGYSLIQRELGEEVKLPEPPEIRFVGLLYDDSRDVSRQHLGLVYGVRMRTPRYEIGERGFLLEPKFETLSAIRRRLEDFENWSAILVEHAARGVFK